ncbi:hypothetical protein HMPREF1219_00074 [Corynebacterium pyruviciproducens ATCC BAA-1742]|uniref:N-acetyltransferase domain-containing protein n=1 Tax=Corynebacterium pyruviciproducens ATCC BAA-1742 TaxID=1125779 RepID=S2ZMC5_9CORY|nr:GNAT family protein [Corynebacterium pyruviciproducens]EPD71137.1 hypothetical protein HMPREF1219_00074 [Corynebacterium pyruviciproducens ATCC BAA-1742]
MFSRFVRPLFSDPESHPGWPEATPTVALPNGAVVQLRPLTRKDGGLWSSFRREDESILRPVEPTTHDWKASTSLAAWSQSLAFMEDEAYAGRLVPLAITCNHQFAGQLTLGNVQRGAVSEAWIGYWVSSRYQGMGVATAAVALGVDHAFARMKLHRLTATYLPGNEASHAVLAHAGFHEEGYLRKALHIDGEWRDHHFVALNQDDFATLAVNRLWHAGRIR